MSVTLDEIKKLSQLSRIDMDEGEMKELQNDMESILGYVEQISEVVTEEHEPIAGEHRNIMREDGEPYESGKYTEDILNEMPKVKDGYLEVKKIL
ncbi:Asp-tRNA(Asn)/Glu-tRNA(Gln) amidotransferase subunit GatC [Patescibacteria group bacterium]